MTMKALQDLTFESLRELGPVLSPRAQPLLLPLLLLGLSPLPSCCSREWLLSTTWKEQLLFPGLWGCQGSGTHLHRAEGGRRRPSEGWFPATR